MTPATLQTLTFTLTTQDGNSNSMEEMTVEASLSATQIDSVSIVKGSSTVGDTTEYRFFVKNANVLDPNS